MAKTLEALGKLAALKENEELGTKFGTFGGVFSPTVLTILGVIMYLRLGWVVGNAGLVGAIIIILLAKSITLCTGLSMASITTNIKIGAGGAYSIIAKSLGLEAGGSIGIPFYVSQTLSAALYIIGFTEGWLGIFPNHDPTIVSLVTWAVLIIISSISTQFAIRIQYVIMVIIGLSLVSFFMLDPEPVETVPFMGNFEDAGFWQVFAIFFPAVTGIMAGANMSGDLKDPRKSIPGGTLWGIAVTFVVYIALTIVMAMFIAPDALRGDQMIMVERAAYQPIVIAGILAATFSSALGSILGSPRILQALAEHGTVPMSETFAQKTAKNEPRNAIIFTGLFIVLAIVLGNLDMLAILITMFFLITYGMLNLVVFIQQSMKIISFRPTLKVPRFVPLFGALGCIFMMFLINPIFSAAAILIIIALYIWLARRGLASAEEEGGDLRGGMFLALAEKASRIAARFPRHQISWKPDMLLPVDNPRVWSGPMLFIRDMTYPNGSIFAFSVSPDQREQTKADLDTLLDPLRRQDLFVNSTVLEDNNFKHGAKMVLQTLKGSTFRPNILFLTLDNDKKDEPLTAELIAEATRDDLGVVLLSQHPRVAFGMQNDLNIWLREKSPNWHLAVLLSLHLQVNWGGKLNLVTTANNAEEKQRMENYLEKLSEIARLPSMAEFHVILGSFQEAVRKAPKADINIFGLSEKPNFQNIRDAVDWTETSCLFVKDSGMENALV